jgi:Bax protein
MLRTISHLILTALLISVLYFFGKTKQYYLLYCPHNIVVRNIEAPCCDSILAQSDSLVTPINYLGTVDFRQMDPEVRKKQFINYLLPSIVITRERLMEDLHHIEFIEEKMNHKKKIYPDDSIFLASMMVKYKTDSILELKKRIYPHPVSLALSQAVLESGWGTSSIARKGHNLFGVLSFSPDDSRLKMQLNDSKDDIYLRTYNSIIESVEHYYLLISRVSSYKKFREQRWEGAPSSKLVYLLDSYHESPQYSDLANSIIRSNNLDKYDIASINPIYRTFVSLYSFLKKN